VITDLTVKYYIMIDEQIIFVMIMDECFKIEIIKRFRHRNATSLISLADIGVIL